MRIFTSCAGFGSASTTTSGEKVPAAGIDLKHPREFAMSNKHTTYRRRVLDAINERDRFLTAVDIVEYTELTYKQVIDVLQALHNENLILREGRKFTAKWGSLKLQAEPADSGAKALEETFRAFFKR
jgi:rRNA maturation protein Nop10